MTVIEGDVPPLLSVGFLEHLGALIDLKANQVQFTSIDVKMPLGKLSSGHRTIPLVEWDTGRSFPVPPEVQQQYGLSSAYVKKFEGACHRAVCSGSMRQSGTDDLSCAFAEKPLPKNIHVTHDCGAVGLARAGSEDADAIGKPLSDKVCVRSAGRLISQFASVALSLVHGIYDSNSNAAGSLRGESATLGRLIQQVFLSIEKARIMYVRLALSQGLESNPGRRRVPALTSPDLEPGCLHPEGRRLNRGNQYARWSVCGMWVSYNPPPAPKASRRKAISLSEVVASSGGS